MTQKEIATEVARFNSALSRFTERVAEDRYVLAVVLVRSLSAETTWARETLGLWIIEADGVSRRLPSDGEGERIFRILVENGINIHAEVIPRARFKKMVEGMSRTAFSCNFFAHRQIVYSKDPSIDGWFAKANSVAIKDQERELLVFSTWTIHEHRHARNAPGPQARPGISGPGNRRRRARHRAHRDHQEGSDLRAGRHLPRDGGRP